MRVYPLSERPDIEVLVDGTWYPGELRGTWTRDGQDLANVQYRIAPGQTYLETLPVERVRQT